VNKPIADLQSLILRHVSAVRRTLGLDPVSEDPGVRFADALDSMGMVEFLGLLGDDCGVDVQFIERAANRQFDTIAGLACALAAAGLGSTVPRPARDLAPTSSVTSPAATMWLSGAAAALPGRSQTAAEVDGVLGRPAGWFERHAGIKTRRIWGDEDELAAATRAGRVSLERAASAARDLGALIAVSEAPPRLIGTAAVLHHRLGLPTGVPALEIGNACTGFVTALWLAQRLLPTARAILVIGVEAPSRRLVIAPGSAGEAAALFGDGAAACLLTASPMGPRAVPFRSVLLETDGSGCDLLRVQAKPGGLMAVEMDGTALAGRAVQTMSDAVAEVVHLHGLSVSDLAGVVAHGGNGRMPPLLARKLGLPPDNVWSTTAETGNLGAASLPATWAVYGPAPCRPVAWVAVGAGLQWGAALSGG
jgi:3-oxoacyl-[acyl-carrier-protein] synthase-3